MVCKSLCCCETCLRKQIYHSEQFVARESFIISAAVANGECFETLLVSVRFWLLNKKKKKLLKCQKWPRSTLMFAFFGVLDLSAQESISGPAMTEQPWMQHRSITVQWRLNFPPWEKNQGDKMSAVIVKHAGAPVWSLVALTHQKSVLRGSFVFPLRMLASRIQMRCLN